MPYTIELISIRCNDAQERTDEPYLRVNNSTVWGPVSMRTGQTRNINSRVEFRNDVVVELRESDRRRDDHFGTLRLGESDVRGLIRGDRSTLTHTFRRDRGIVGDARYTLTYDLHQV
ncbi:hypothetical protein [Desulfosediminicola flagellatus]|uniref:hypothetical protein n=1 Tax=Desulfosediminicola flagellatus TaxID=2569541 RepID=UPI0010AB88CE|nr:hypothetical protein [Desulfosediminicola flagellatus]